MPFLISYVILRIALLAFAIGNCISKVLPDADLSLPKSNTATAALEECESLYIKAPLAVKVAFVHETLLKSTIAVVPLDFGKVEATVKEIPPAVYADPEVLEISLEVL
tara:strand:+ start:265 stop:588 length:324 start_codon:yes stop_codon:yes gene_type:complete